MSILSEVLKASVEKNIPTEYQSVVISNLSPLVDKFVTAENIEKFVEKIAAMLGAHDNLVAIWKSTSDMKTEDQVAADAQANLEESAAMVNENLETNRSIGSALTNIATMSLLIALKLV